MAASVYSWIGDNRKCDRKWDGWEIREMDIGKCGRERYRTFGENACFYRSITVQICKVVIQNHVSQVIWVYFSQGQKSFVRGGKVLPVKWRYYHHLVNEADLGVSFIFCSNTVLTLEILSLKSKLLSVVFCLMIWMQFLKISMLLCFWKPWIVALECLWTRLNESPWKFRGWEGDDSDPLRSGPGFHLKCHGEGSECLVNSVVSWCFLTAVFKPEELRQALMPTLEALYRQDPESLPFRQPVDPQLLGIPVS